MAPVGPIATTAARVAAGGLTAGEAVTAGALLGGLVAGGAAARKGMDVIKTVQFPGGGKIDKPAEVDMRPEDFIISQPRTEEKVMDKIIDSFQIPEKLLQRRFENPLVEVEPASTELPLPERPPFTQEVVRIDDTPESLESEAIKNLGFTTDAKEAGFVLNNGSMIDLSGKNQGGTPGRRNLDHRKWQAQVSDNETFNMWKAMEITGALRVDQDKGMVSANTKPTSAQLSFIRETADVNVGDVVIDLYDGAGKLDERGNIIEPRQFNKAYEFGTPTDEIMRDVTNFYENTVVSSERIFPVKDKDGAPVNKITYNFKTGESFISKGTQAHFQAAPKGTKPSEVARLFVNSDQRIAGSRIIDPEKDVFMPTREELAFIKADSVARELSVAKKFLLENQDFDGWAVNLTNDDVGRAELLDGTKIPRERIYTREEILQESPTRVAGVGSPAQKVTYLEKVGATADEKRIAQNDYNRFVDLHQKLGTLVRKNDVTKSAVIREIDDEALMKLYRMGEDKKFFYKDAADFIADITSDADHAKFLAALTAITSVQSGVGATNIGFAFKGAIQQAMGEEIKTGRFPSNVSKQLELYKETGEIKGRKLNNFLKAMEHEIDKKFGNTPEAREDAVNDLWMGRIFGFRDQGFATQQYNYMTNRVAQLQQEVGDDTIDETQAALWAGVQKLVGRETIPLEKGLEARETTLAGELITDEIKQLYPDQATRAKFEKEANPIFFDKNGKHKGLVELGIPHTVVRTGFGAEEGDISGSFQVDIFPQTIKLDSKLDKDFVEMAALVVGAPAEQRAIAYSKVDDAGEFAGMHINVGHKLDREQSEWLAERLNRLGFGGFSFSDQGIDVIDFSRTGKKRLGKEQFYDILEETIDAFGQEFGLELGKDLFMDYYRSSGDLIDVKSKAKTRLKGLTKGRSASKVVEDLSGEFGRFKKDFIKKNPPRSGRKSKVDKIADEIVSP